MHGTTARLTLALNGLLSKARPGALLLLFLTLHDAAKRAFGHRYRADIIGSEHRNCRTLYSVNVLVALKTNCIGFDRFDMSLCR